ncbi:MAG: thiamine phosphate synthase [Usitatibacter sp.]
MTKPKMASERGGRGRLRGLYAITPDIPDTPRLALLARECLEGGAAALQYRAKGVAPALALVQARQLATLCRAHGALFIVNDSLELALAVEADGVHLGRDDEPARHARMILPSGIIGVSCYDDPRRAQAAAADGADYVAIGSLFASSTKPGAVRAPLAAIGEARASSGLPVVAIGGITHANAHEALAAGADMVAVIGAVFSAEDVRAAARAFARLFDPIPGHDHVRPQPRAL